MRPPIKYSLAALLYEAKEDGIWEYDAYRLLKATYSSASLDSIREVMTGFSTIGWLSVTGIREHNGVIVRKFRLQDRHRDFIERQFNPEQVLGEIGLSTKAVQELAIEKEGQVSGQSSAQHLLDKAASLDAKQTRVGMFYGLVAAPALGLGFSMLGIMAGKSPFNIQYPTGLIDLMALETFFGAVGILLLMLFSGQYVDIFRVWRGRMAGWLQFYAVCGFVGDSLYASGAGLAGGAIAGPIAGLYGVVGAIITSILYREKILRWYTILGLILIGGGIWFVSGGAHMVSPVHGVYLATGLIMVVVAMLLWGVEIFGMTAGTDLMPAEVASIYRSGLASIFAIILLLLVFPKSREILPMAVGHGATLCFTMIIGVSWAIFLIMGFYVAIAYAGAVRGGALGSTLGFFFVTFFSMTIYGLPWSTAMLLGSIGIIIGALLMISEPGVYLSVKRQ